ncbi:hypothetical protein F4561_002708 [Lipingzhangella halophila]|uniref:Uncharacterized protein n=1 Tax=Lipingzhangella halophila TaxID=1783352 RepID=A0A7W7W2X3_9ACTN|nr:hypothetical protein [Lipingzhangella halophila]MBB4931888.1 hypothetical protein [Lipingzhangella halophila]
MYLALAIAAFVLAAWSDGKIKGGHWWWIPLGVGVMGSMLLYASSASQTMQGWMDVPISWVAQIFAGVLGESLPHQIIYGIIATGLLLITIADLAKDHSYNRQARTALVVAPIAAHGAGGWVGDIIATVHGSGADIVVSLVDGMFG